MSLVLDILGLKCPWGLYIYVELYGKKLYIRVVNENESRKE